MDTNSFMNELAYILETSADKISMKNDLNKFESWDSLAMMTFVVVFRDKVEKEVDPMKVSKCLKVLDLYGIVK